MRVAAMVLFTVGMACAQFKDTASLVIAPITVMDAKGRFVNALTEKDLVVYDNGVPQTIQVEGMDMPVSLVVAIQANTASRAILDKLRGSGLMFSDLVSGERGETALVSFGDDVSVVQEFTPDATKVSRAMRRIRPRGNGCALLDGILESLRLLETRGPGRRRIILVIGERRDRSSQAKIADVLQQKQMYGTAMYWLTYSTFLAPFTSRTQTVWDRMTDEEKEDPRRMQSGKVLYAWPEEETPLPPEVTPGSLISIFSELKHKTDLDAAAALSQATGGRSFAFLQHNAFERVVLAASEEIHRQYIVLFQPKRDPSGPFHTIRAEVRGRPDLQVRTRAGYWPLP